MIEDKNLTTAAGRVKSSLHRQRTALLIIACVVVLLAVAFGVINYFTSRISFTDPQDGTEYYVVKKDDVYIMRDKKKNVLEKNADGNYVTAADTIVNVNKSTGVCTVVAAVMTEGDENLLFNSSSYSYDILLYPHLERTNISEITVHNELDEFTIKKARALNSSGTYEDYFMPVDRPDLLVSESITFTTLVNCVGYTRTKMRLSSEALEKYGYAEYGLPADPADATRYFIVTDTDGNTHRVIYGDMIPSGDGYYVRYDNREAVYVVYRLEGTEYYSSTEEAVFGKLETYITPVGGSAYMTSSNYFDVSNFKVIDNDAEELVVDFSYAGSADKRSNTFYSTYPYEMNGALSGYYVHENHVDSILLALYNWAPNCVVSLGRETLSAADLETWLDSYGLGTDSHAFRLDFTFNIIRSYDSKTGEDSISRLNQEHHVILVSHQLEDGTYNVYNICYIYNSETGEFDQLATGYNMIVNISADQVDFVHWDSEDWVDVNIFGDNIAYCDSVSIQVAAGNEIFPEGKSATFYLDNSASLTAENLSNYSSSTNVPTNKLVVRDGNGFVPETMQFKRFYGSLLYTTITGPSSFTDAEKQAAVDSGDSDAALVVVTHFRLLKLNAETGLYEETGETIERHYCFYTSYAYPREAYVTINGAGDSYVSRTRMEKVIRDLQRLYSGETIVNTDMY